MNKLLDLLADIEGYVEMAVDDHKDRENIMDWVHQAMDIAVKNKAHKWPEEKPPDPKDKKYKRYLLRHKNGNYVILDWKGGWWDASGWLIHGFTHWWELPEVTE